MILYRVEAVHSEEYGFPVPLNVALDQIKSRAPKEESSALRILRVEYELNPTAPPTIHTNALRDIWRATVLRFPDIGTLGVYACKPLSQHRYGNAADWAASREARHEDKVRRYLGAVADWQVAQAMKEILPIAQVIVQKQIWQRGSGWEPYTGIPHVSHVHTSAYPMIQTSLPCGPIP